MAVTGTLRIRYRNRETAFEYNGLRERDVLDTLRGHLAYWTNETVKVDGVEVRRTIPPEDVIAEWVTDAGKPEEVVVPVPVS